MSPDDTSFKAAAAGADWAKSFHQILNNKPGDASWPITSATYIMMHKSQDKPEQAAQVLKFFDWAYSNGDQMAAELDYVPMPAEVKKLIAERAWSQIKDASGKVVSAK